MALPKNFRLKKKNNFDKVKRHGQVVQTPFFFASILDGQKDGPKFAFVVSKKIDKKAVVRNKIRRYLSEAIRILMPQLKKDVYAVFFVKKEIKNLEFNQIKKEISKIYQLFQ